MKKKSPDAYTSSSEEHGSEGSDREHSSVEKRLRSARRKTRDLVECLTQEQRYEKATLLIERANTLSSEGNYEEAYSIYNEILTLLPDNPEVRQNCTDFCYALAHNATADKDHGNAVLWYKRASEVTPNDADILLKLGAAQAESGDAITAVQTWAEAVQALNPSDEDYEVNVGNLIMCLETAANDFAGMANREAQEATATIRTNIITMRSQLQRYKQRKRRRK